MATWAMDGALSPANGRPRAQIAGRAEERGEAANVNTLAIALLLATAAAFAVVLATPEASACQISSTSVVGNAETCVSSAEQNVVSLADQTLAGAP